MASPLQRAIDALEIEDVSVRSVSASLADGFEPRLEPESKELQVALKHQVTGFEIIEISLEKDLSRTLLRVLVDVGVRWSEPPDEPDADDGGGEDPSNPEVAAIEATMVAEYAMAANPGEDALTAFALQNACFHVWPYWREYVSSQCQRMNLPRVMLPIRQFAQEAAEKND